MKREAFALLLPAILLLSHAASAQPALPAPPPKFPLQLNNVNVDQALITIAHAGNVNIIADATEWPTPTKTISVTHENSAVSWLSGIAYEFDLTYDAAGADQLVWLSASTKNFVVWHEPPVDELVQKVRELAVAPTVREVEGEKPLVRREGETDYIWNLRQLRKQEEQIKQDVIAFLRADGWDGHSLKWKRDYRLSQLPAPLQESLRQLSRAKTTDARAVAPLRQLSDDVWKDVHFRIYSVRPDAYDLHPRNYSGLGATAIIDGKPTALSLPLLSPEALR